MKTKVTLNERQLKNMIFESVLRVLNEYDEPFPYDYKDAREREAYFQRAVRHDFPTAGRFKTSRSWEDMYYDLTDKKQAADKAKMKADKQKARDEKKQLDQQRKAENAKNRERKNRLWAKAVKAAFTGDDAEDSNYDGLMDLPIVLKDGSTSVFHADSYMEVSDDFFNKAEGYGRNNAYDGFSFSLGGTIGDTDDSAEIMLAVETYVSPMNSDIVYIETSSPEIDRLRTRKEIANAGKREAIKYYRNISKKI